MADRESLVYKITSNGDGTCTRDIVTFRDNHKLPRGCKGVCVLGLKEMTDTGSMDRIMYTLHPSDQRRTVYISSGASRAGKTGEFARWVDEHLISKVYAATLMESDSTVIINLLHGKKIGIGDIRGLYFVLQQSPKGVYILEAYSPEYREYINTDDEEAWWQKLPRAPFGLEVELYEAYPGAIAKTDPRQRKDVDIGAVSRALGYLAMFESNHLDNLPTDNSIWGNVLDILNAYAMKSSFENAITWLACISLPSHLFDIRRIVHDLLHRTHGNLSSEKESWNAVVDVVCAMLNKIAAGRLDISTLSWAVQAVVAALTDRALDIVDIATFREIIINNVRSDQCFYFSLNNMSSSYGLYRLLKIQYRELAASTGGADPPAFHVRNIGGWILDIFSYTKRSPDFAPPALRIVIVHNMQGYVLESESGEIVGRLTYRSGGDQSVLWKVLNLSSGEPWIVGGCTEGSIVIWSGDTLELQHIKRHHQVMVSNLFVYNVPSTDDEPRIVSGHVDGRLQVLEGQSGELLRSIEDFGQHVTVLTGYVFHDRQRLVVGGTEGKVCVYDAEGGELLHDLQGHTDHLRCMCCFMPSWAPDQHYVVSVSHDATTKVWDAEGGRLVHDLKGHTDVISSVCVYVEPNEGRERIAAVSVFDGIIIWDAQDGTLLRTLDNGTRDRSMPYDSMRVYETTEGWRLVSSRCEADIKVWDPESGELLRTLEGHTQIVTQLHVFESEKGLYRLVSGDTHGYVRVWDLLGDMPPAPDQGVRAAIKA